MPIEKYIFLEKYLEGEIFNHKIPVSVEYQLLLMHSTVHAA